MHFYRHLPLPPLFFCLLSIIATSAGQAQIDYTLNWTHPSSHYVHITVSARAAGDSTDFRIPVWRPGRYVLQNYARNVVGFRAEDAQGAPLVFRKIDKSSWRVWHPGRDSLRVSYSYYANELDGGSSYLDDSECYINPITSFAYIPGRELEPVRLRISKPASWRIATALQRDGDELISENYHEFVDGPILISPDFLLLDFDVQGVRHEIAIQGEFQADTSAFVDNLKKIVIAQTELMDDMPLDRYLFMFHLLQRPFGHGVEHKFSTSIVLGPADFLDKRFYRRLLSVSSHEYFHIWNVERIRPAALMLPDYSRENYTTLMWLHEGITSYFSSRALLKAGLLSREKYLENRAAAISRYLRSPARAIISPMESSFESWIKSQGQAPPNTYMSFYSLGDIIGTALDLELLQRTKGRKGLAEAMQWLNETYARKNLGIPDDALQRACEAISGRDFSAFFQAHVQGVDEIDFARLLEQAGLALIAKEPAPGTPEVWLGLRLRGDEKQTSIANVVPNSPAYAAGLARGDILIALDGRRVHRENYHRVLRRYKTGDRVTLTVIRNDRLREFSITCAERPVMAFKIVPVQEPGKEQQKLRNRWLFEK